MKPKDRQAAPESIPDAERLKLWVRSGGRCAMCKTYLLEDEFTGQVFSFGEMAHNVGRKRSALSPRGLDPLPIEERNKAENLLLLCGKDHKLVDDRIKRGEYSVKDLRKIKQSHEDRIKYLTGLQDDRRTTVLRVVGDIRGASVELSREHVRRTVLEDANRYPDFPLAFRGQDFEIDLRDLPGEGTPQYWQVGQERLREALQYRLQEGVRLGEIRHISLFAIARIPLLVSLGYLLDDKIPMRLYQKHRDGEEGWRWSTDEPHVEFEYKLLQQGANKEATRARCLRGEIVRDQGQLQHSEPTAYRGNHYVECFVVKNGVCVARDRQPVIII